MWVLEIYRGQQMANQYAADAQKLVQGLSTSSSSVDSNGTTPPASAYPTSPSQASPESSSVSTQSPNSCAPASPSNTPTSEDYKQLMS